MTNRPQAAGLVAEFLRDALTGGALGVPQLEVMARAGGLLRQSQSITHSKLFKRAKKALGIRSVRDGFGAGRWLWQLPRVSRSTIDLSGEPIGDTYPDEVSVEDDPEEVPAGRCIPSEWISGVASLQHRRAPPDIPRHRWRQFLSDCNNFLTSSENWAGRAAQLGWDAKALFGCRRNRPLMHPGSAGLLWAINGGRLIELHGDWAVIELAVNGSRRVFERRRVDAANVALPWIGP
jgi:hypothetical protein